MHSILDPIARQAMQERNFLTDFSPAALQEALSFSAQNFPVDGLPARDLRHKPWFSIDNDESRDLDQLTYAENLPQDNYKVYVAIACVSYLVKPGSQIDVHAFHNTTSVYTPSKIFPMLPERLSTDLTSLNPRQNRLAMVFEGTLSKEGSLGDYAVYFAYVHNYAQLAYDSVSNWLDGNSGPPGPLENQSELQQGILLQSEIAQLLANYRLQQGALSFETVEPRSEVGQDETVNLKSTKITRARKLIENFMILANEVSARFSVAHALPVFRRVVTVPKRWEKIVSIAAEKGERLPETPDSPALERFLIKQKNSNPLAYPDLSLTIIKLLGRGEYKVSIPGEDSVGHFGLALRDYTHSTAPNRRYPDLITQRLLAAKLLGASSDYESNELSQIAAYCSLKEIDAEKVERRMQKSAAALALKPMVGKKFEGIITGSSEKGTWVRLLNYPVEGKLLYAHAGIDVGDQVYAKLIYTDVLKGFIDFEFISERSRNHSQ